jgi:hypothetical protein
VKQNLTNQEYAEIMDRERSWKVSVNEIHERLFAQYLVRQRRPKTAKAKRRRTK